MNDPRGIFVGAYASSPCYSAWNPDLEAAFLKGLVGISKISGLELPFFGALHRFDSEWLLKRLHPEWDYLLYD